MKQLILKIKKHFKRYFCDQRYLYPHIKYGGTGCIYTKYCTKSFDIYKSSPNIYQIAKIKSKCCNFIEYNLDTKSQHF